MLSLILIVTVGVFLTLILYQYKKFRYWEKKGIPSVNILSDFKDMFLLLINRTCFAEFGLKMYNLLPNNVYGAYLFNMPILLVKDPEMLRKIMIKDFEHFTDHMDAFMTEEDDSFFGKNLFALKGQRWHSMRTTLSPVFTGSKIRIMFHLMQECGDQLVEYFDRKCKENGRKILEIEFLDTCTKFTNDVITTIALGIKVDSLENPNNQFYKIGLYSQNIQLWRFFMVSYLPRVAKFFNIKVIPDWIVQFFRTIVKETIEIRERKNIIRPDMIHVLNEARKGLLKHDLIIEKDEGFAVIDETEVAKPSKETLILTEDDLVAQAFIFFAAGFGNTAITMCWASYELACNPEIQNKLYIEIKETLEGNNKKLTYDILLKMKYLDLVVTETLRKWPPLPITHRKVTKPYKIKTDKSEILMETGMFVGIPIMGLHRDPKYYPKPEQFEPERFTHQSNIHPLTYLPFGNGPRICIGSRLALLEVKVFLVYMLPRFEFTVIKKTPIPPVLKYGISLEPRDRFWLGVKQRNVEV